MTPLWCNGRVARNTAHAINSSTSSLLSVTILTESVRPFKYTNVSREDIVLVAVWKSDISLMPKLVLLEPRASTKVSFSSAYVQESLSKEATMAEAVLDWSF